jgi:hypothetical protein
LGVSEIIIMIRFLFFIVILVFFFGCVKDGDINIQELAFDCESSEFEISEKNSCDSSVSYDPFYFCEYRNLGDVFLLTDSRGHLKYMCSLIRNVIFENNSGDEISFGIESIATQYATQWSEPCPGNAEKSILFCAANEEAMAVLINDSLKMEFRIMLIVENRDENVPLDDRDRLFITVPKKADFGTSYSLILSYYIKRGNIYESFNDRYQFAGELELNGNTYRDVTYVIPSEGSGDSEIYYTEKYGIVGFRDGKGVLWTFVRFGA